MSISETGIKPQAGKPCECEHDSHSEYGSGAHRYTDAPQATEYMHTIFGTFAVCADCARDHDSFDGLDTEPESDQGEPDEDSYVISDVRGSGSRVCVSQYGRVIFECLSETAPARIRAHMESAQFFPDVWSVNDHGNALRVPLTDESDPARIVYVNGIGWRDCDTLLSVIGFDAETVQTHVDECLKDERERVNDGWEPETCEACEPETCDCGDSCDCDDPSLDDLDDYGASVFTLADVIRDCLPSGSDGDWKLSELLTDGYAII